jgi:uncharacterized damage-inducible protein DinB
LQLFFVRWENSKIYTYEIFEAMPESMFNFQPTSEMMSYSKLFTHIGHSLHIYASVLDGFTLGLEPDNTNRGIILDFLKSSFKRFDTALEEVNDSELYLSNHHFPKEEPWKDFTVADMLMIAYNHIIHHRAQATTYLRLKGIIPPKYRF